MQETKTTSTPNWRAIALFYFLACLWSWPFFWWRDIHPASWNAWHLPDEIKGLTQPWGPALAAIAVVYLFPQMRSWSVSLLGGSWKRSALCFTAPILFAFIAYAIQSKHVAWKLIYYLVIGGFSTLGEELGWRGFLQGALRPLGRIRGYLLLAFLWEAWHLTSHTKGTLPEVISRLEIIIPIVIAVTFTIGFLTERTGSILLATTVHEWVDLGVDSGGYLLWAAMAALPIWLWIAWKWPQRNTEPIERSIARSATAE